MNDATRNVSESMQALAAGIDKAIEVIAGERIAFTLLVYTEGRASYVSSCSREDAAREMRRLLELWDAGMPDVPNHEIQG